MLVWAAVNTIWHGWDVYPYILLNLLLSMLAGLQGAILLIAAKRQDTISAALAQHDFDTNTAAKIDIELLLDINERQLVMIEDLRNLMGAGTSSPARLFGTIPATVSLRPMSRRTAASVRRGELDLGVPSHSHEEREEGRPETR
jgi:hypothetical protein